MTIDLNNLAEVQAARAAELKAELAAIDPTDTFAQYWAQSAVASVERDYKAGRFFTLTPAQRKRAAKAMRNLKPVTR
jgi:hypothetical protein